MPGAGHVVHMPSHIYYRIGRYRDAAHVNELAALVDEQYIAACHAQGYYPIGYYGITSISCGPHPRWRGATKARSTRRGGWSRAVGPGAAKLGPQAQLYYLTPVATLLRFGKWDAVLAEPLPPPDQKVTGAIAHLARGFAYANKGDRANAAAERAALAELANDEELKTITIIPASAMVDIALNQLDGEIARTAGNLATAVADFTKALEIEEALPYTEPPYWHQPTSHLLGAALLQAGRAKDAENVYRKSLTYYRLDGWALYGLAQAQDAEGDHVGAEATRRDFAKTWTLADVTLTGSRF
ncbi:MAG: tetratricopeptide repeat protein [Rhizomicrobium sp.]